MSEKSVIRQGTGNANHPAGVGYIIVPRNIPRQQYIKRCKRTGVIGLFTESHAFNWNVRIDKWSLQMIEFPKTSDQLGSGVVWINVPVINQMVVIGTLPKNDEMTDLAEAEFQMSRETEAGSVSWSMDAEQAQMNISVVSKTDGGGEFVISVGNKSKTGKVELVVKGDVIVRASNNVEVMAENEAVIRVKDASGSDTTYGMMKYRKGEGMEMLDEFGNKIFMADGFVQIFSKNIKLADGKSSLVLGEELKELMKDMIDATKRITVNTGVGPSATPTNQLEFDNVKAKLDTMLSKVSKTD